MKIQDYKIGNIYKDTNGKSFILDLSGFNRLVAHHYATAECLFDAVIIDGMKLKALGFKEKTKDEFYINLNNQWIFVIEYDNDNYWHFWLNGKHLTCIMFIHELQDLIRIFAKQELELK